MRVIFAHAMSRAIADGLPPCSRVPPAKCRPAWAQECPQPALRNRGANGKQGRRERVAPRNVPQGSPYPGRSPAGPGRRGGLTFELCQQQSRRSPSAPPPSCVKTTKFPDGFTPGVLPVCRYQFNTGKNKFSFQVLGPSLLRCTAAALHESSVHECLK